MFSSYPHSPISHLHQWLLQETGKETELILNDISQILDLGKSGNRDFLMSCIQVQLIAFKKLSLSNPPAHLLPQHGNGCQNLISYGVDNYSCLGNLMLLMPIVFSITRLNKIVVAEHYSPCCLWFQEPVSELPQQSHLQANILIYLPTLLGAAPMKAAYNSDALNLSL